VRVSSSFGPPRQVKLLRKVAANYSPRPPRINRRGERKASGIIGQGRHRLREHHADAAA
jgi:hypothetical protein